MLVEFPMGNFYMSMAHFTFQSPTFFNFCIDDIFNILKLKVYLEIWFRLFLSHYEDSTGYHPDKWGQVTKGNILVLQYLIAIWIKGIGQIVKTDGI